MCGRFVLATDAQSLQTHFQLDIIPEGFVIARYNIAPTQPVIVITNTAPKTLTLQKWGLIPSWSKDPSIASSLINARAETLHEKPSFRTAFKRRRCLIPATGFYEWGKGEGKTKQPYYIHLADNQIFAFAGLWETWHSPDGDMVETCTIITTEPNDLIRPLHHRMAVILDPHDYELWLSPDELPPSALMPLLNPYPQEDMRYHPVSSLVNNVRNDSPECIKPFVPPDQSALFT
ncbi:MAG: hypothetical protein CUN52_04850 [Phototrophicales bacterium]|nr:MAG: hypothetical protein CUN52_04850 [Phototrophicales bacterium]